MDLDMLQHPATQNNITLLKKYGSHIIDPSYGELASGLVGAGRMAEPEEIIKHLAFFFDRSLKLKGKKALVTAGPTYEAIDPVRFISNHSSGKMGFAIAEALADQGAEVTLVTGPTHMQTDYANISIRKVTSAEDMFNACSAVFNEADITVLSAAVADYRPSTVADQKIKKKDASLTIELTKTTDIAASLGQRKQNGQFIVGFALETENEQANAFKKLQAKNFDLIVLNSLNDTGAGFGYDTNKISILDKKQQVKTFSLKNKKEAANDIVMAIIENLHA